MATVCNRHSFEYAESVCSSCGLAFCHDCLVYPKGPKKPPLCVHCAIAAAGVRSSARKKSNLSKREVRRRTKQHQRAQNQPATPFVEPAQPAAEVAPAFEVTSSPIDPGWAVSWNDEDADLPSYPSNNGGGAVPHESPALLGSYDDYGPPTFGSTGSAPSATGSNAAQPDPGRPSRRRLVGTVAGAAAECHAGLRRQPPTRRPLDGPKRQPGGRRSRRMVKVDRRSCAARTQRRWRFRRPRFHPGPADPTRPA